jgi:SAM-dependent methyltransferase
VASDPYTDRTVLTTEAYADPGRLTARYSLYEHRRPLIDLPAIVARLLRDVARPVLDVGCGPGRFVAALRADRPQRTVVAVDLSPGMARAAGAPALVADAAALPVASGACGAAMAMHMLYHVPDPEAAVRELARVTAPGGTVLISTNAEDDKRGLYALCEAATADVPGAPPWDRDVSRRFGLDPAETMAGRHFASVQRHEYTGDVILTEPEPAVAFVASLRTWQPGGAFSEVLDRVRDRVAERIATDGAFRFGTRFGILVCR